MADKLEKNLNSISNVSSIRGIKDGNSVIIAPSDLMKQIAVVLGGSFRDSQSLEKGVAKTFKQLGSKVDGFYLVGVGNYVFSSSPIFVRVDEQGVTKLNEPWYSSGLTIEVDGECLKLTQNTYNVATAFTISKFLHGTDLTLLT